MSVYRVEDLVYGQLLRRLARTDPQLWRELHRVMTEEFILQARQGFIEGRAPDGTPWRANLEGTRPLLGRGRLRGSLQGVARPTEGRVFSNRRIFPYGSVHQRGAVIRPRRAKALRFSVQGRTVYAKRAVIPQRPFLPEPGERPVRWEGPARRRLNEYLRRLR